MTTLAMTIGMPGLTEEEIEKMVKDAEANAEADAKRKEEAEVRNEADQLAFQVDKTVTDLGENISEDEKKSVEDARDELKKALEGEDIEAIKAGKEKLEGILQPLVMKMYEQAAAAQQAAQGGEGFEGAQDAEKKEDGN